jgi:hypothetical protein
MKILISGNYGAGWYSWNTDYPDCLTNEELIEMVEAEASESSIREKAKELYPEGYWGGASGLQVVEIESGTKFVIHEYDGAESIMTENDFNWIVL